MKYFYRIENGLYVAERIVDDAVPMPEGFVELPERTDGTLFKPDEEGHPVTRYPVIEPVVVVEPVQDIANDTWNSSGTLGNWSGALGNDTLF